ncbi:OmpH family outer membrane protein, partial [Escherichia coli]
ANTVAVWNSQVAINNTNIAKTKIGVVQAAVKPKQQQLDSYKATIERLQKQYATQNAQMTQAQKDDLRKQIQTNLQNYEQVASQIQSIIDANEAEVMQRIVPKIQAIKENIVRQKNIDVLIDNRDRTVSYVKPEWDVT